MRAAILLCAGEQQRLAALGYPKQLIRIAAEPMLYRTVRQLRARGIDDITCVRSPYALSDVCATLGIAEVVSEGTPLIKSAADVFEQKGLGQALVLLGDVCWSDELLDRWLSATVRHGSLVCRRIGPSAVTGKAYSEHFGLSASSADFARFDARRFYRLEDLTRVAFSEKTFEQPAHDWTEDIDTPADVESIVPILSACALRERARAA